MPGVGGGSPELQAFRKQRMESLAKVVRQKCIENGIHTAAIENGRHVKF